MCAEIATEKPIAENVRDDARGIHRPCPFAMNHPAFASWHSQLRVVPRDIALDHITHCLSSEGEREMGYEIYIGEWDKDAVADEEGCAPQTIALIEHDDAPSFDEDSVGRTNCRKPSYGTWKGFCRAVGVDALFNGPTGLLVEHPGTVQLTKAHARTLHTALKVFRAAHRRAKPTFASVDENDHHLARLEWLVWWTDWALANCMVPAMHNR